MVCQRCIMVVTQIFTEAGVEIKNIQVGTVTTKDDVESKKLEQIKIKLEQLGFEIIHDSKRRVIEQIKAISIEYVYQHRGSHEMNFSDYLSGKLHLDYPYLSTIFSYVEGITIEKYLISLKIERVKELLVYDEKSLSEIAWELGYSSVAHLSGQFKKVTGFTTTYFKSIKEHKRQSLNDI